MVQDDEAPDPATPVRGEAAAAGSTAALQFAEAASAIAADPAADFADLYQRLRRTAQRYFRNQPQNHTLGPTALVHEAFVRIANAAGGDSPPSGERLAALCATAMRHVLVDHARRRAARNRALSAVAGSGKPPTSPAPEDILALDQAITALKSADEEAARLVELRIFCGLGLAESAAVLGIARSTASKRWRVARAWLAAEMRGSDGQR